MIKLSPWRPDIAAANTSFAADVRNALPMGMTGDGGMLWGPFKSFSAITDAADSKVLAARGFVLPNGTRQVVLGTAEYLYLLDLSDGTLDDVSGTTYSATEDAPWHFDVYGQNIIAVNPNDKPQRFVVGSSSAFADLNTSDAPQGQIVSVWKDQLVIGGLGSDGEGVAWSEINDITDWTGANSDTQLFPGFGKVTALSRGNTNFVIQEYGIHRGVFTGSSAVFEFDMLTEDFGCRLFGGTAFRDRRAFLLSDSGFKSIGLDGSIEHIGHGKVDNWARDNIQYTFGVHAALDPHRPIIYWACSCSDREPTDALNTLLAYDIQTHEWTRIDVALEWLFGWQQQGWTLEQLDVFGTLESLPYPLDSQAWMATFPYLGGVDLTHKVGQFAGENLAARLRTAEFGNAAQQTRLRSARPLIDTTGCTLKHFRRDNRGGDFREGTYQPLHSRTQQALFNTTARWHMLELQTDAGAQWSLASGLDEAMGGSSKW